MSDRLDGFLSHRGFGTRSEARTLIKRGRVTIDGAVCHDPSEHVRARVVAVSGQEVAVGISEATLLLYKPLGLACSHDPREAPLIETMYPAELAHLPLETAGRLDRETSGLVIATTDGELIHSLTNPRRHVLKRYRIGYTGQLSTHAIGRVAKGLLMEGDPRPTLPAKLVLDLVVPDAISTATLYLAEGRYHQVRRMIATLGGEVVRLHRDRIGALELPLGMQPGTLRALTAGERDLLFLPADDALETMVGDEPADEPIGDTLKD